MSEKIVKHRQEGISGWVVTSFTVDQVERRIEHLENENARLKASAEIEYNWAQSLLGQIELDFRDCHTDPAEYADRINNVVSENARLREALKPFADAAKYLQRAGKTDPGEQGIWSPNGKIVITAKHFIDAKKELQDHD